MPETNTPATPRCMAVAIMVDWLIKEGYIGIKVDGTTINCIKPLPIKRVNVTVSVGGHDETK